MKICIVSPISLNLLDNEIGQSLPQGYRYPLGAMFVKELLRLGHKVMVVTNTFDVSEVSTWRAEQLTVVATPRRRPRQFCLDFYRQERRAMLAAVHQEKPDIVHAHWTYEFAHVAIASGLPYIVTARDYPPAIFAYTRQLYRLYRLLYSFYIIPQSQVLVANSPYLASKIEKVYRKSSRAVIPNGIASDFTVRKSYDGCVRSAFNVTLVANWDRRKNVATAMQAFALARKDCPEMELHLFGAGLGPEEEAARYAKAQDLCSGLRFHGYQSQEQIRRFHLERTDVLLHPSLEESFGMTVLEAMAIGIPVIGGQDAGAVPWVVGEGGYLVDVRKPEAIAQKLVHLSCNRAELIEMGTKAQARAQASFSMASVVDAYLGLYQKVISEEV